MRWMLLIASGLVFVAGIQLFVFSEQTDTFFAWTIDPPLTAASLGAAYWASCALEFFASTKRTWAHARIAVPAVLIFTGLTLVVTLLHLDRFHLNHPDLITRGAAWAWLLVYAVVPPLMSVLLLLQLRAPGGDPPRRDLLPGWMRGMLFFYALVLLLLGMALLLIPQQVIGLWPWSLTPLTGRAIGAWALALGVAAAEAIWENDWERVQVAAISFAVFGAFELVALARYPGDVDWGRPRAWIYTLFIASTLVVGVYGWRRVARVAAERPVARPDGTAS
jgi:hypothetical protein